MSDHTQRRITFQPDGDANHYSMIDEDGNWWLALIMNSRQATPTQVENLRRLAACWNACIGMPTDDLENGELWMEQQRANAARIDACVNACRGLPTEALDECGVVTRRDLDDMRHQRDSIHTAISDLLYVINRDKDGGFFICEEATPILDAARTAAGLDPI